jgi:hypothetical protein
MGQTACSRGSTSQTAVPGMSCTAQCNSTDVGSRLALAFAAIDESGDPAEETEHHAKPD